MKKKIEKETAKTSPTIDLDPILMKKTRTLGVKSREESLLIRTQTGRKIIIYTKVKRNHMRVIKKRTPRVYQIVKGVKYYRPTSKTKARKS